jgi:hypothetical protein
VTTQLAAALNSVDWKENVAKFLAEADVCQELDVACKRIAIWSKQLENVEARNPAITFVRAIQVAAHQSIATMGLGIYKATATSVRGLVENALYYTYFRSHPAELASLIREKGYYVTKADILAYHKVHTPGFKALQEKIGLVGRVEDWYSRVSAIVHGQIPGIWVDQKSLSDIKSNVTTLRLAAAEFREAEWIVHHLLLTTVGRELWDGFAHNAKKSLLQGMAGDVRAALELDRK